ncbi:WbqC family protein [Maribacter sp. MMG018]|uniref:WbqC family protein n=1 Tax=Maribacter sp. MMG018 TaxID=2822688 RepID=UPI001B381E2C|nr:WbqC family protein [Maribacter sp. MMG018]MBQ4915709.1 WbqC family protein [Maribacter sp. MMG018]
MHLLHPAYFPNIAFFSVFINDKTIWETQDNFQKQTYRNRAYICTDRGRHMLSIPIIHGKTEKGRQLYKDVKIDNSYSWQRQHWRTLETAYRTSPFFEFYEDEIKPIYEKKFKFLMDINLESIALICEALQLQMPDAKTSTFELNPKEEDFRFLINAKQSVNYTADHYTQVFGERHGFIPNTSILDALFNLGPNTVSYLKQVQIKKPND